jgi:peptidyl-prolyl cis-trans isomerase C
MPLVLAVSALAIVGCKPQNKDAKAADAPPVATVNGKPISAAAFQVWVTAQTNKKLEELSPEQKKEMLQGLEGLYVSSQEAEKQNVGADPQVAARIELDRMNVLATNLFQNYAKSKTPTEADLKAEYDRQVAAMPKVEYHAAHILLKDEAAAKDALAQLAKGAKFEEVAKKMSTDPGSKDMGGDLSWFTPDKMVPEFSTAVAQMKKGDVSKEAVKSQFGFHIIKLIDTRELTPPPYDAVKDRLGPMIQQHQVHDYIDSLKKSAKIEEKL